MRKPFKEVKYIVGDEGFGDLATGTCINAVLLAREDHFRGLIYHPYVRGECASFEICVPYFSTTDTTWQSMNGTKDAWINIPNAVAFIFERFIFGQQKFKRIISDKS